MIKATKGKDGKLTVTRTTPPKYVNPYLQQAEDFYKGDRGYRGFECLDWKGAFEYLRNYVPIKRVAWLGYWVIEKGKLVMHCKDGSLVTLGNCDEAFTLENMTANDWVPVTQGMRENLDAIHKAKCLAYKKGK